MLTRDRVLRALQRNDLETVSGGKLARELGISRTAVWKQMQLLRRSGIPIESVEKAGYRIPVRTDLSLTNLKLSSEVRRWVTVHYDLMTSSTQDLAKVGAKGGVQEGHLWIAEVQTQGRGRLDRVWDSAFGGLWMSLLLRPPVAAAQIPSLTLIASLALAEAITDLTGINIYLKWPNDLVVWREGRWKKVAGILTEMSGQWDRTDWIVMGIGLNVNNRIPSSLRDRAASIQEITDKIFNRASLLNQFLKQFKPYYLKYQRNGFNPFTKKYWNRYGQTNRFVSIHTSRGEISGLARGVDAAGKLLVESRGKIIPISEGEIEL